MKLALFTFDFRDGTFKQGLGYGISLGKASFFIITAVTNHVCVCVLTDFEFWVLFEYLCSQQIGRKVKGQLLILHENRCEMVTETFIPLNPTATLSLIIQKKRCDCACV